MAVTPFLYRLVFGGTHFGLDEFSIGLHMHSADLLTDPAVFAPAIKSWFNSAAAMIPNASHLEYVKFNAVNPLTGKYASPEISRTHLVQPFVTGFGAMSAPQLCYAISTRTVNARGRGHAGRMFPPISILSGDLDASGRLTTANQGSIGLAAKTLFNSLNAVTTAKIVVFSKLAQTITPVTGIQIGRVVDTQRRRRSSLVEDALLVPLA